MDSWIGTGTNQPVQPQEPENAVCRAETERVAQHSGMERTGPLAILSQVLPRLVDGLTPNGRMPQRQDEVDHQAGGMGGLLQSVLSHIGIGGGAAEPDRMGQENTRQENTPQGFGADGLPDDAAWPASGPTCGA